MKVHSIRPIGIPVVLSCLLLMLPRTAHASVIVVGDGMPASCTASALKDALAAAATPPDYTVIRFDCGDEPLTITMRPGPRLVIPDRTTVDGGDRITIFDGEGFLVQ